MSGEWLALGVVGALAFAGSRRGSLSTLDPHAAALDTLEQRLRSQEPGLIKLVLVPWNKPLYKTFVLASIEVDHAQRGRGVGERVLSAITGWADAHDQTILLTPEGSKRRLERWYGRHGFVRNKGRNKDFRFRESMYRRPRQGSRSQASTLQILEQRDRTRFHRWLDEWLDHDAAEVAEALADPELRDEYLVQYLTDERDLTVREDGLVEIDLDLARVPRRLIADLPLALFHGTSTALLPSIREHGLRPARHPRQRSDKTFSTMAGVYLSTRYDVGTYASMAAAQHGGDPVILTVRRTLDELEPDPDDEHLQWATSAMQWITPWVPTSDIVEWS